MRECATHFFSSELRLDASFYLPKSIKNIEKPIIIACSGFLGLKDIHPVRFGRALTNLGYPCFGFDYRGFAESEGKWRKILVEEQIYDIVNAVTFVSNHKYGKNGVILLGWGMGAGLILEAAKEATDMIKGLIAVNGFYASHRTQEFSRGKEKWGKFYKWVRSERLREIRTGQVKRVDPFEIYPLDEITEKYVKESLARNKNFGGPVEMTFAYSLLRFHPEARLVGLENTPILIAHGDKSQLHPPSEMTSLAEKYPGDKETYWVPDAGHTEWMQDDNPKFLGLIQQIDGWIKRKFLDSKKTEK